MQGAMKAVFGRGFDQIGGIEQHGLFAGGRGKAGIAADVDALTR